MASRRSELGVGVGLRVRMYFVLTALVLLYLFFVLVLLTLGMDLLFVGILAAVLLGSQYYFSDKLVLRSMGAKKVSSEQEPKLHSIVDRLVVQAEMPKPVIAVADTDVPNAFATGRNPNNSAICVTTGMLRRLDDEELEAVIAHELSHVKSRDVTVITLASFFAVLASMLMRMLFWMTLFGGGRSRGGGGAMAAFMLTYFVSVLVYFLATLLILALSRYREYVADRNGAIMTGHPSQLASALMKISGSIAKIPTRDLRQMETANAFCIVSALRGESIAGLFASHPPMEKRIERLRMLEQEMEGR